MIRIVFPFGVTSRNIIPVIYIIHASRYINDFTVLGWKQWLGGALLSSIIFTLIPFTDNGSIIQQRRKRRGLVADGIFKTCSHAVILWKSIMPVGGRVAGKGVGVYNSGGSSDGKSYGRFHARNEISIYTTNIDYSIFRSNLLWSSAITTRPE